MRITWVTRDFLDYRIPVFEEINKLSNNGLTLVFNSEITPQRCVAKIERILGDRAVGLTGEISIGNKQDKLEFANTTVRIPIQKGLIKAVKNTNPDIIIGDGFFQWTMSAYWFKIVHNVPLVMLYERTFHTERIAPWWRSGIRRVFSRFIDKIGCNGVLTYEYVEKAMKFPKERLFMGNMAADTFGLQQEVLMHRQNLEPVHKSSTNEFTILYVGRLIELKGLTEMLMAWKGFVTEAMNVKLKMVGGGIQESQLKDLITTEEIKKVDLLGAVDYSEVSKFYATADIFIIPTLEDNWSLVVPEAMSCGLPILCSKYNGCWPELVTADNGWVFDPLDETNFIDTLKTAWERREEWEKMGENSVEIVSEYTPEKVAIRINNGLLSVVK